MNVIEFSSLFRSLVYPPTQEHVTFEGFRPNGHQIRNIFEGFRLNEIFLQVSGKGSLYRFAVQVRRTGSQYRFAVQVRRAGSLYRFSSYSISNAPAILDQASQQQCRLIGGRVGGVAITVVGAFLIQLSKFQ